MDTLVIIPGWRGTATEWSGAAANFPDVKTVVVELPGFGQTPLISDEWGVPEYADYVLSKIAEIEPNDIIIIGHSFGGRVASYIASTQPKWLKGLILYGAPCLYRPSLKIQLLGKVATVAKALGFSKKLSRNHELLHADQDGLGKIFRKTIPFDQTKLLPNILVKTYIIWGSNDDKVPLRIAHEMNSLIPKSELEIIDGGGHHLHLNNQYIFYAKIKNFIQTL